jgi:hypothetical protein
MIDTDRYKGHTPGPWVAKHDRVENEMSGTVIYDRGWVVWVGEKDSDAPQLQNSTFGREELNGADARLIADAPLLLAEVERLRKENELMVTYLRYMRDGELTDKDWLSVNELIGEEE